MTYNKQQVLVAANKTAQECRADRKRVLAEYDSHSWLFHFFSFLGPGRPDWHRVQEQKVAERISFKVTFCNDLHSIELSDHEIDIIRDYWGIE